MRELEKSQQARAQSRLIAMKAGIEIPDHLPLLDPVRLRDRRTVTDRALCLHAVLHMAHGWDIRLAKAWLQQEGLIDALTPVESDLLRTGEGDKFYFKSEVEALWALMWALGLAEELDPWKICADNLARRLPDVDARQSSESFRASTKLRSPDEVLGALDLAYCTHWAVRQAQLDGKRAPANLDPLTVEERRHALEWLAAESDWDEPSMDT